jgi:hypothetical protein
MICWQSKANRFVDRGVENVEVMTYGCSVTATKEGVNRSDSDINHLWLIVDDGGLS